MGTEIVSTLLSKKIEDVKDICIPEGKMFIFPERYSLPSTVALCKSHGGCLFTPRNKEDNSMLFDEAVIQESTC